MCSVLARSGMLDLREYPRVSGGHDGSCRLHHSQVLHSAGNHFYSHTPVVWAIFGVRIFRNNYPDVIMIFVYSWLGGRRVWQKAPAAHHAVSLHQLAGFRSSFHSHRHAQIPQEGQDVQPAVCRTHSGTLQVRILMRYQQACLCVWCPVTNN